MNSPKIPNNLKKYRRIAGYSQKEVALLLGFSYTAGISKWEKGFISPGIEYLFTLSHLYSALPHELYPGLWQASKQEIIRKTLLLLPKRNTKSNEYLYL